MITLKQMKWQEEHQLELEAEYDRLVCESEDCTLIPNWGVWIEAKYQEFKATSK